MDDLQDRNGQAVRRVLIADPECTRRARLARRCGGHAVFEAASLCEAFPLAESHEPDVVALSSDFLVEPEVEGLFRLAAMLGCRVFLYSADGPPPQAALSACPPCIPLLPGDSLEDLMSRAGDPRAHLAAAEGRALPAIVLIGASTGGVVAIESVLRSFPADCPPTLVVQHIREGFVAGLVRRLNGSIRPQAVEAQDGARLQRGTVYFAGDAARHLIMSGPSSGAAGARCALVGSAPVHGHRPAVDVLFESALPWAPAISAALLTGMGADGAAGLGALRRAGAHTIAQDRDSCVVWGMPRVAVETGAAAEVLSPDRIGAALLLGRSRAETAPGRRP